MSVGGDRFIFVYWVHLTAGNLTEVRREVARTRGKAPCSIQPIQACALYGEGRAGSRNVSRARGEVLGTC